MLTIREVTVISSKIKKDEEDGGVAGEWKYAAMVMDRSDISYLMMMTIQIIYVREGVKKLVSFRNIS